MYAPMSGMNDAIQKIQIARKRPKVATRPSALVEEKSTKYPRTNQNVAGARLIKKHMTITSVWK